MSNSVVKVTETPVNDSLILVIGEDGTVTPDKKTVEAYLSSRTGETELRIMQVNKSDGKTMDVTVDTLTYLASHNEEENTMMQSTHRGEEMTELERNLLNFRMDHDYTPLTSPHRPSPVEEVTEIDELAQTLSILEGNTTEEPTPEPSSIKVVRINTAKSLRRVNLNTQIANKPKVKTTTQSNVIFKQPNKNAVKVKNVKQKPLEEELVEEEEENYSDEDFAMESEESDDANDSDFEIDESPRAKLPKKRTSRSRVQSEPPLDPHRLSKTPKIVKPSPVRQNSQTKIEMEPLKIEKPPETIENKTPEKKPLPKKEKKPPKPIPDDFALFSTPDIIRRVGGKQDNSTPTTPTTPVLPESPKTPKPAKIFQGTLAKPATTRSSLDSKDKRLSIDGKSLSVEKDGTNKHPVHRLSVGTESKNKDHKDRRHSLDVKVNRPSLEGKPDMLHMDKISDVKKLHFSNASAGKSENHIAVQNPNEPAGGSSNEAPLVNNQLEPVPSAEDIRAIIQNEDTKTFTSNLVIPENSEQSTDQQNPDQSHINLETAGLDLDQSILDNINSDLISEDILYQVAQSLVDNPELQNAIDKSLVEENLGLDTSVQHAMSHDNNMALQQSQSTSNQAPVDTSTPVKGTQIMRSGGRMVVIPPIERPATRSRNKKKQELESPPIKPASRIFDDEHVSGGELDSSSDDDKSDDDPDKLWCICNQPHNNRFMICCDTCEEWYHGKCVNVTKAMGQMMEQEGKEWICVFCKDLTLKRPAAAARRIRKASRTSSSTTDLTINEKKEDSPPSVESTSSVPGCLVCGKPCRTNSIYCSDPCILKHAKVVEKVVVFDRSSGKIYSGNSAPSAANLDKWLQQHPGFEVVRSTNANKPVTTKQLTQSKLKLVKNPPGQGGVSLAVQRKGVNVNILRHSPKQPTQTPQKSHNKQNITGFKIISKQVVSPPKTKLIQPVPIVKTPGAISSSSSKPKLTQTKLALPVQQTSKDKEKPMPQKTPKSRQAEETAPQPNKQENIRDNVKKTLFEQLTNRLKLADDMKLTKEEVTKISNEIESQLYKCFGDTGQKYRNKYRSLIFNIKDIKNQTLWRRICEKSINPYQLVRLSPDDLASQELALWRERENKHQLDMITKSELEQLGRNRQYVFKTHKGEQVLEDSRPTDAVDNTEVIMGLGAKDASPESPDSKKDSKDKDRKSSKHSRSDRDRSRDHKSIKEKEKVDRKDRKRDHRSSSRDRSHRKRSRSKDHHSEKHRSRSREKDKERYRRSSHKSSRHRRDSHNSTEKLDKKSKEILEQLVDNKIVPPLEDRLWKHVQQEDITTAPVAESDSDHEPSSTVTIPTPPRSGDLEDLQSTPVSPGDITEVKDDKQDDKPEKEPQVTPSFVDDDGSRSPPPRTQAEYVWKGTINMVDVAQISITAHEVSGDCSGLGEELPPCLDVVGRISPDTVWDYIGKMKCSNSKAISLLRLNATNMEEKMPYIALYSYLSSRNRLGVVKSTNKAVKDFYILPLASQKPIPQSLLPLNGPGFEESRPALLLGIIVRDKRKRPLLTGSTPASKRTKVEIPSNPVTPTIPPIVPGRSYTPPPATDPRIKQPSAVPKPPPPVLQESPENEEDDMDEPYSPEDSDPDTMPAASEDNSKTSSHLNSSDLSNLLTGSVKSSSFLETGLTTQTFEPFSNKFDTIPGLDESAALPANSQEIQRKMEELDQRIAMQKAEIDNMSQDIASSTNSGIGTTALANIALPSNLQQILDSIKGINPGTPEAEAQTSKTKEPSSSASTNPDLTMPLVLPKISARSLSGSAAASSPTIPLNLPKPKSKFASPKTDPQTPKPDKSASVLSSLSEEDLIRKAAEMLGETDGTPVTKSNTKESNYSSASSYKASSSFTSGPIIYTPPPNIVPPPLLGTTPSSTSKSAQLDMNQPPIPGLDD